MKSHADILLTAVAPLIWGSTYLVTTELLPAGYPLTLSMLRALPAGLLLLLFVRNLPPPAWWGKILVLGALNFSVFWALLFVAAYQLPGGVAATLGATQPVIVIFLAYILLRSSIFTLSIVAAGVGLAGVALLVLTAPASLSPMGVVAGLGSAVSMAAGTVLTRKWQPPVSLLTFTAWQLTAGGLLLLAFSFWYEPPLPPLTTNNVLGLTYLSLIGAAFTYALWFRGISRLQPSLVSTLAFLSPVTAALLGWSLLGQNLTPLQLLGVMTVLASIWLSQRAVRPLPSSERKSP